MYIDDSSRDRLSFLFRMLEQLSLNSDPVSSINTFSDGIRTLWGDQGLISVSMRGLAEGEYRAIARNEGKVYEREFKVVTGVDGDVEVLAR